jgi:hypothetical protein
MSLISITGLPSHLCIISCVTFLPIITSYRFLSNDKKSYQDSQGGLLPGRSTFIVFSEQQGLTGINDRKNDLRGQDAKREKV